MQKTWLSWSTGKDSAWTLHSLRQTGVEIHGLICTVNQQFDRVAMHAVRSVLLRRQAQALGLELMQIELPWPCSNEQYEQAMESGLNELAGRGVDALAFGDLFLEDVRQYREKLMASTPIKAVFPLWQRQTDQLAWEMIDQGLRAVVTCVDPKQLPAQFVGRQFDAQFLDDLPSTVDPCGENGEFHTYVYDGPMFTQPIEIVIGDKVERDGFHFADIVPR